MTPPTLMNTATSSPIGVPPPQDLLEQAGFEVHGFAHRHGLALAFYTGPQPVREIAKKLAQVPETWRLALLTLLAETEEIDTFASSTFVLENIPWRSPAPAQVSNLKEQE